MPLLKYTLKYQPNTADLFTRISHKTWAIFLDSGQPQGQYGRYDILVADPFITISSVEILNEIHTEIVQNGQTTISHDDPFVVLNQLLAPYQAAQNSLPFSGGAVGYFGYDLMRREAKIANLGLENGSIPQMMLGIYDWAVVVDHREKTACLVSHGFQQATHDNWAALCALFDEPFTINVEKFALTTPITSNMDFGQYANAFNKIKHYITEGDCYQVNLAQRFSAQATGNSWVAYNKLREISPAPFMAYMNFGHLQVLSGSPERFLQVIGTHVETRP
ncbi:MAG: chorismate-binding protein, partial [Methylotenera sp.]